MKAFIDKLKRSNSRSVGIDTGSYAMKAIEIEGQKIRCVWKLRSAEESVGEALKKLLVSGDIRARQARIAISDEKVERMSIPLPKLPPKEWEAAVTWELKKTFPQIELSEFDFSVRQGKNGDQAYCVIAPRDLVRNLYESIEGTGVLPASLETESMALQSCLCSIHKTAKSAAIAVLGHSSYRLIFLKEGEVAFTRSLYFGLSNVFHTASTQLSVTEEDLALILQEVHLENPAPGNFFTMFARLLQESLYSFCDEFRRSELFAREQQGVEPVTKVFLCGGGACIPESVDYLSRHLEGKKVHVLDPFQGRELPQGVEKGNGPKWAAAYGLAVQR